MLQHSKLTFFKGKTWRKMKWNKNPPAPCFHLRTRRRRGVAASFYCAMKTLANLATQRGGKAHCWDTAPSCSYLSGNWRPVISSDMNTRTTQRCCVWWANKGWCLMTEILTSRARPSSCSVLCTIFTIASPPVLLLTLLSSLFCVLLLFSVLLHDGTRSLHLPSVAPIVCRGPSECVCFITLPWPTYPRGHQFCI